MNNLKDVSIKSLLHLATPIMLSQTTETIMLFTDRLFLSGLGTEYIGPSMSGGLSSFVFQSFFIGLLAYLNAITAQHYGAAKNEFTVRYLWQGFWLAFFFYPLALLLILLGLAVFLLSGHSPSQLSLELNYFSLLMTGAIFVFLKTVFAAYLIGLGKTGWVWLANLCGMLINIPLNYLLIYGKLGFPALKISGAALGTIAGSFLAALLLFIFVIKGKNHKIYFKKEYLKTDCVLIKKFIKFGFPAGAENIINVFAFNLFIQFMHSYGPEVAASITIAFNFDLVAFIPLLGFGAAVTTMVGYQIGAGDILQAQKALKLNLIFAYAYATLMVIIFLSFTPSLVALFSKDEKVVPLAEIMLKMAAIYTLADATHVVFAGALRGAGDTRWVMILSAIVNWSIALNSFILTKFFRLDPLIIWGIFVLHVLILGVLMVLRYSHGKWKNLSLVNNFK